MPRKVTPMKYRGFYCSDELFKAMQDIAISLNESDSEYIRKAIEERNAKHKPNTITEEQADKMIDNLSIRKEFEVFKELAHKESIPTIPEPKEKPKMVQSFMKGGK